MKSDEWIWLVEINYCLNFITVIAVTYIYLWLFVVQSLSHVWLFVKLWPAAHQASLSFTISQSLLKLMSFESMMSSNHFVLCCPLLLLPSIFPRIRVFSNQSDLRIRWPKYWSFRLSTSPSNENSGLISFRIDWFNLLAVQGTLSIFSNITIQKHYFFGTQPSLWPNSHIHTWLLEKQQLWLHGLCWQSNASVS